MKHLIIKIFTVLAMGTLSLTAAAQQSFGAMGFVYDGLCYNITGVNTVEVISRQEFGDCGQYPATVVIPATVEHDGTTYTVTRIGDNAFNGCSTTSVTLPSTIEEIGRYAFSTLRISSIDLPASLRSIGFSAFFGCSRLSAMHLPASVSSIGAAAFSSTSILEFTVDSANSTFCVVDGSLYNADTTVLIALPAGNPSSTLTLPASLRRIEAWAIGSYPQTIVLPQGLREIGEGALPLSIDTLRLPASVCRIEGNPVGQNPPASLVVVVDEGNTHYTFADGRLTSSDGDTLLLVVGASGDYQIPAGVKVLANELFYNNTALSSVTLPEGLTDIGEAAFLSTRCSVNLPSTLRRIGLQAFMMNSGMREVVIPAGVRVLERQAFSQSGVTSVVLPDSLRIVGREAFNLCMSLTSLQLGSCLEEVHPKAFYTTNLNALPPLPASLRTVGEKAFDGILGEAEYVEFLGSPDTIGGAAFNMSEVRFRGSRPPVMIKDAFWRATTVHVPCGCSGAYSTQQALAGKTIEEDCDGIDEVDSTKIIISAQNGHISIYGALGEPVYIFDAVGRQIYHLASASDEENVGIPCAGVYIVKVGNSQAKKIITIK